MVEIVEILLLIIRFYLVAIQLYTGIGLFMDMLYKKQLTIKYFIICALYVLTAILLISDI